MAFCTNCGSSLDPNVSFCPECGTSVAAAGAAAVAVSPEVQPAAEPQPAFETQPSQPQPDQQQAKPNQQQAIYTPPVYTQPTDQQPQINNALLNNWKTNVGMTILGILGIFVISEIAAAVDEKAILVYSLLLGIAGIVYAAVYYPSFFTEQPKISDVRVISFLNGLLGGVIFGCLWNSTLTKRTKGVSYIVFIVLAGMSAAMTLISLTL